jgi:hypothetical protein
MWIFILNGSWYIRHKYMNYFIQMFVILQKCTYFNHHIGWLYMKLGDIHYNNIYTQDFLKWKCYKEADPPSSILSSIRFCIFF